MERQITHLIRLVDDLLDVSRITRGKVALDRVPLDARQSVNEAVAAAHPLASAKRLTIRLTPPAHATDAISLYSARILYKRKLLTS